MQQSNEKINYLKSILKNRFNSIPRKALVENDYNNFSINIACDVFLKNKIIEKFNDLKCKEKKFINYFGNLTFKEAYATAYFEDQEPRCPFCGQLLEINRKWDNENKRYWKYVIADIEHIFPKSKFPQLALHPDNLVPCCKECNEVIKQDKFFTLNPKEKFNKVLKNLNLKIEDMHPLALWRNLSLEYDGNDFTTKINSKLSPETKKFLNFYGIEERGEILVTKCFSILFNIIRHSDIRSPESLERLLENMASANWHEINDGYSLNNSPQIWREFIENILYDECKLMALWDEVKASSFDFF